MNPGELPPFIEVDVALAGREAGAESCLLHIKAVPGARRDEIAGRLGDRLKVRVSAPAEDGKANTAICAVIADALGVRSGSVSLVRGQTNPEKTVRIVGVCAAEAARRLGEP